MAHALGGYLDLAHGMCNALLLEHVVRFNFAAAADRYSMVGRVMGLPMEGVTTEERQLRLTEALADFCRQVGIHQRLKDVGVSLHDIPLLAGNALRDPCLATNPLQPLLREVEIIYEQAF
jgi:alcohol dehydrogenase